MSTLDKRASDLGAEDIGRSVHVVDAGRKFGGTLEYYHLLDGENQVSIKLKNVPDLYKISYRAWISVVQDEDSVVYNKVEAEVFPYGSTFNVSVSLDGDIGVANNVSGRLTIDED